MRAAAFGLNQVKVSEYYIGTCQGKDARHRISTNMEIMKILIQNYLQEIFLKNIHLPQNTSGTQEVCPYPNTIHTVVVGNFAPSSFWFESGFSGCIGLIITSLICEGSLMLDGVPSFRSLSPMRNASTKKGYKVPNIRMTLTPKPKTSSLILEILKILIQNQVKPGEYYIGTCREKDAVLRWQLTFKLF